MCFYCDSSQWFLFVISVLFYHVWAAFGTSEFLVNPLEPQNADKIRVKIADLGNACWVVSNSCRSFPPSPIMVAACREWKIRVVLQRVSGLFRKLQNGKS